MSFDETFAEDSLAKTGQSDQESRFAKIAALSVFGAATGYVLYNTVFSKQGDKDDAQDSASDKSPAMVTSKALRRERINTLRSCKVHLHQFEYAWGAQAHLRMANVDFDEHNIRYAAATACNLGPFAHISRVRVLILPCVFLQIPERNSCHAVSCRRGWSTRDPSRGIA